MAAGTADLRVTAGRRAVADTADLRRVVADTADLRVTAGLLQVDSVDLRAGLRRVASAADLRVTGRRLQVEDLDLRRAASADHRWGR